MAQMKERGSTRVYRQIRMFSEEELIAREKRCVHEAPAYCDAVCPLKLDVKAMLADVAKGSYDAARRRYDKVTPFPHLLCEGCDAPCEGVCKHNELGEGLAIREVERAVVKYGTHREGPRLARLQKKQRIALFGSGLFILYLTGELRKKTYPVTVYCEEDDLSAFLDSACASLSLSEDAISDTLALLGGMGADFRFGVKPDMSLLKEERESASIIACSRAVYDVLFAEGTIDGALMYDRKNDLIAEDDDASSLLRSAFSAKKAALTADRLAQHLDPANTRGEEGAVSTDLYTNTEGIEDSTRVPLTGALYTSEEASAEASRCISCHCDECMRGCAYLRHYKTFPRMLTREIYNNVNIIMGDHIMNRPINSCALCGQCTVLCPNGYDMTEICLMARQNMVQTDKMPLAPHEFALMDQVFSNEESFYARPQPGFTECRYVFFPGCQAVSIAPETIRAAYDDLCKRLPGGVGLISACCGAISAWAGRTALYEQTRTFLDTELAKMGDPTVITACPTCSRMLSEHVSEVCGIWDVLNDIGLPAPPEKPDDRIFAIHDGCGARGDHETQAAVRRLIESAGCGVEDTSYSGDLAPCCGYGGLTSYANREVADLFTDQCLARSDKPFLTYCMSCRDRFTRAGRESRHLLELIYGNSPSGVPDISGRRTNRLLLKKTLLGSLFGEEGSEMPPEFTVLYTEEARKNMDERMILTDDVFSVLSAYRESGEAILHEETSMLTARKRIGNATFWVTFTDDGNDSYTVHSAYSHRMQVELRSSGGAT